MLKKKTSIFLLFILMLSMLFAMPFDAQAASKMALSASSTVYTTCTTTLTVKVNNKKVAASKCTFTSSNKNVATVSTAGVITGVKKGTATITAKLKSNTKVKSTFKVTVKTNTITSPAYSINFAKGCSNTLVINVSGNRAGSGTVSFASSNTSVATVDKNGKVTAKAKGTANITVKVKKNTKIYRKIKITVLDGKSFSITPSSVPLNGTFLNYGTYNSTTKNYYTIRSYLEYFENHSGCTLTFKSGTYNMCTALYIPSNTTLKLSDGVVLKKTDSTATSKLSASSTMFMFCAQSKANTTGAYSAYNGVHDVKIIGTGSATINMKGAPSGKLSVALVMCHNKNITVSGIKFTNMTYGHFIEMDASKNVTVTNCTFTNQVHELESSPSECINLDTPDSKTNGFHQVWAVNDSYANDTVTISNCKFSNVQRAVGTHQYSQDSYHKNITVNNCSFTKCVYGAVYAMNWKNTTISNNTFNGIGKDTAGNEIASGIASKNRALFFAGCYDGLNVTENTFKNCYHIGAISSHQANDYDTIYNSITDKEFETLTTTNYYGDNVDDPCVKAYANWDGNNVSYKAYQITNLNANDSEE